MNSYKPQELLNMLHEINIPHVYASTLPDGDASKLVKQKLQEVRGLLRGTVKAIEARWDGRDALQKEQETLELEPYTLIETLITRLETRNVELEIKGLREALTVGTVIYGTSRDWHIGNEVQAKIWSLKQEKEATLFRLQAEQDNVLAQTQANIASITRNIEQLKAAYETRVVQEMHMAEMQLGQTETALKEARTTFELNHDSWKYTSIILIGILLIAGVLVWAANAVIGSLTEPPASTLLFAGVLVGILFIGTVVIFGFLMAERDSQIQARRAQSDILRLNAEKEPVKPNLEKRLVQLRQNFDQSMNQLNQKLEEMTTHEELTRSLAASHLQTVETEFDRRIEELEKPTT